MLIVITFESMFGNTREIAEAVAEGFRSSSAAPGVRVELAPAAAFSPELATRADLLVVGAPTHYQRLATRNSIVAGRQLQRRAALAGRAAPVADHADDADLRAWLRALPRSTTGAPAAAFDTRLASRGAGGAAYGIARRLRHHGYHLVVPPQGFVVDGVLGPLRPGELERARRWGSCLRRQLLSAA